MTVMMVGAFGIIPVIPVTTTAIDSEDMLTTPTGLWDDVPDDLRPSIESLMAGMDQTLPADKDIGLVLGDRMNDYRVTYEPWKSKAAIHAIAYDEGTGFLALGGGYLYDNQVHIFRLNTETKLWDKVWDTGDGIFGSDVMALDFGDTDLNDFIEIVAGCADGHVYVFEQRHIYDPYANTENQFDHVWTSPNMFRVFDVKVDDIDRDYRPDIIAGGWDGKIHIFEYSNHSGYPFTEEHWITYDEVSTLEVGKNERIYSIETGDTNYNGLPEIICGTREGTVYVFENDGLVMMINGQPFPLINDNNYYLNWSSENYTWTPILSMSVGELDGTPGDEIALVAQGQGVFTLDWNELRGTYDYEKVYRDYEEWETFGFWQLDFYVDRVVEANNVTYHDPVNASLHVDEPIQYEWNEGLGIFLPDASVYPYNSGMAGPNTLQSGADGNFSTFDSSIAGVSNCTAVLDFGQDEEGTGGANDRADVMIYFKSGTSLNLAEMPNHFNFSISKDGDEFEQVSLDHAWALFSTMYIDVDDALSRRKWDYFRYVKISVFNDAVYDINGLQLVQVYNTLTDAISVEIGPLRMDGMSYLSGTSEPNKILAGTVTGELIAIQYNSTQNDYDIIWESWDDDFYTFGANIWDMEYVGNTPNVPTWNWQYGMIWNPVGANTYNSWSYGVLNPWQFGSATFNYFMGTNEGEIRAFTVPDVVPIGSSPLIDPVTDGYFSSINSWLASNDWVNVSVEAPWFIQNDLGTNHPMIALGVFNPDVSIENIPLTDFADAPTRAAVMFYYREDDTSNFIMRRDLYKMDTTGELVNQINLARAPPKLDFADFDKDGDLDFVVSNGYLYMARNMWMETEGPDQTLNFTLVRGYFDDINNKATSKIWGQPELVDIDSDGDMDLILSYANSKGATCWINEGTKDNPIWVEDKQVMSNPRPETNMKYQNFTDVRIVPKMGAYYSGYTMERWYELNGWEMDFDWTIAGYRPWNQRIAWATPEFDTTESYIVASYPRVAQLDFSLMSNAVSGLRAHINIGFHVHESWSNDDDLKDWTLAITSADVDNDGKGELIVGDYDNNVYAFEHLGNNTYKRMFRSFDLNHTVSTDASPYLHEELEGISGDFNRRIWDHAKHLVAGVDLDQDGLREIIVAANLQVYIFEEVGLFGGDEVRFVYSFDLRDTEWSDRPAWDLVTEITAMAAGDDLDHNGELELAVAAGPYLFIYNVPEGTFDNMEDREYFVTSPSLEGRYFLVGNPELIDFRYYEISTLVLCDTDQDGYREVILGGTEDVRLQRPNGFAHIYECQGGTFYKVWEAPIEVTYWNPVSVIKLDDQDYDGAQEIIIGHTFGFDMWEWIPGTDSEYQKVEYVTSSPNYPKVPLTTTYASGDNALDSVETERSIKDMARGVTGAWSDYILMVYENSTEIWYKLYNEPNDLWSYGARFSTLTGLAYSGNSSPIVKETRPTVIFNEPEGDIYVAWEAEDSGGIRYLALVWGDIGVGWNGIKLFQDFSGIGGWTRRYYPSVFQFNSTHVGLACTYDSYSALFPGTYSYGRVAVYITPDDLSGGWTSMPVNFNDRTYFQAHDVDIIRLHDDDADGNYSFAIAMSAVYTRSAKADHDVWVVVCDDDSNFNWTGANPHQATTSFDDEMFVDIDQSQSEEHALMVIYESMGVPLEDRIGMVSSTTLGREWNLENTLNTIPEYIIRTEMPSGYIHYSYGGSPWPIYKLSAFSPDLLAMDGSGFMYTCTFSYAFYFPPGYVGDLGFWYTGHDIVYGINPQSDWTMNHLRDVVDLDTGDTDADGRREVIVGFDNQVGVYEMKHSTNGTGFMTYEEAWLSDAFQNPVTGVTVYDTNGNGWDEIGIATERGDVYIWEYVDPSEGAVELWYSEQLWTTPTDGNAALMYWADLIDAYDVDGDGYDEIFTANPDIGRVAAYHPNGSLFWENTDAGDGFNCFLLSDLNNDTVPEILAGSDDTNLYVLDITTGAYLWSYNGSTDDIYSVTTGNLEGDAIPEIVMGDRLGGLFVLNGSGTLRYLWNVTGTIPYQLAIGNFTEADSPQLACISTTGELYVINPLNGSVFYQSPSSTAFPYSRMRTHDFNDDGFDDIVFSWDNIRVADVHNGSIYYNSTIMGTILKLYVEDFDGDGTTEILALTLENGLHLEEVKSGITQWHYKPDSTWYLIGAAVGHIGGSGEFDIIACGGTTFNESIMLALDGKNGIPKWFNYSDGLLTEIVAARLPGSEYDSIVAWDVENEDLVACQAVLPTEATEDPAYENHEIYWDAEIPGVYDAWVDDVVGDYVDEVLVAQRTASGYSVLLLEGSNANPLWNISFSSKVQGVQTGYIDGYGHKDVAIWYGPRDVLVVDGLTGANVTEIYAGDSYEIRGLLVGDFDTAVGDDYDEIAVLKRRVSGGSNVYVAWYDEAGNELYNTFADGYTSSYSSWHFIMGRLSGDGSLDVAFGASGTQPRIYNGDDGSLYVAIGPASTYRLLTGNLTGGSNDRLIVMDSSYDVHLIDTVGGGGPTIAFPTGHVRDIAVGDVYNNDGSEEVIINVERIGAVGYNAAGTQVWKYNAPLVLGGKDTKIVCADMNGDMWDDLVLTNREYINVVDGETGRLLWHYWRDDLGANYDPIVGRFYDMNGRDVLCFGGDHVYVVAHTLPPPIPPAPPQATGLGPLIDSILVGSFIGVPILFAIVVVPMQAYRKRRRK